MAESNKPKLAPRAETMQRDEVQERLSPHYLPDINRTVMARDAAHAAELAKTLTKVIEDEANGRR